MRHRNGSALKPQVEKGGIGGLHKCLWGQEHARRNQTVSWMFERQRAGRARNSAADRSPRHDIRAYKNRPTHLRPDLLPKQGAA